MNRGVKHDGYICPAMSQKCLPAHIQIRLKYNKCQKLASFIISMICRETTHVISPVWEVQLM